MPNWCSNEIRIWCQNEEECNDMLDFLGGEIKEMVWVNGKHVEQVSHRDLCFSSILPEPEHTTEGEGFNQKYLLENGEEYDWYNWRTINWGVKWEPNITYFDVNGTDICIDCDTPWGPPEGIYDAIVDKFPEADISWFYREDGMQFAGWLGVT